MDITQLLITIGAIAGVILIGVLAVVPSFLDRPGGADQADPDEPHPSAGPTPAPPADTPPAPRPKNGLDLAA